MKSKIHSFCVRNKTMVPAIMTSTLCWRSSQRNKARKINDVKDWKGGNNSKDAEIIVRQIYKNLLCSYTLQVIRKCNLKLGDFT